MRQSNIELLRIISILLVCILHADFGALNVPDVSYKDVTLFTDFARIEYESISLVAVNVFILISGYFSISLSFKRIAGLCFIIVFWSAVLTPLSISLKWAQPSQTFNLLTPGLNDWFIQCYLLLVLLSPLCNLFINNISLTYLKIYISIFFITELIFGWFIFWGYAFYGGYSLLHFIGIYLIGRYIKLANIGMGFNIRKTLVYFFVLMTIPATILFATLCFNADKSILQFVEERFTAYTSPFNIIGAILLLIAFREFKLKSKFVNKLATSVFSVYIIHTFPPIFIWYKRLSQDLFLQNSLVWIITLPIIVCLVFGVGFLLDQIRIYVYNILKHIIRITFPNMNSALFSRLRLKV